ncbi:MAG: CsgG/HfaB family protein [Acidobacteriia bacterium]|nr:CsgG/HfaB family protein [Terriglobia bacterium]
MGRKKVREAVQGYMRLTRFILTLTLATIAAHPAPAQDLKPVSTALASQISSSGRKRIAVVDFTDLEGNVTKLGRYLAEELSVNLLGDAKGFQVIDRTHLKAILQEHRLSATGVIDPQTARKLGEIVGADALVTGTITPFGDTVHLSIKAIDPATASMVAATTADIPKTPAIGALLGESLTSPTISTADSTNRASNVGGKPASIGVTVQSHGFVFAVQNCHRVGDSLTCLGSINNQMQERRVLDLSCCGAEYSQVIDNNHVQYALAYPIRYSLVFGARGQRQKLENDLPVTFKLSVENFSSTATSVSIVLSCMAYGDTYARNDFKVTLRNIQLSSN